MPETEIITTPHGYQIRLVYSEEHPWGCSYQYELVEDKPSKPHNLFKQIFSLLARKLG